MKIDKKNVFGLSAIIIGFAIMFFLIAPRPFINKRAILSEKELKKLEFFVKEGDSKAADKIANHYFAIGEEEEGKEWLKKASDLGSEEAKNILQSLSEK